MTMTRDEALNQIRYAERLCARTARLYRRLQTVGTWATIVGGSAALLQTTAVAGATLPPWAGGAGVLLAAAFGAALLAVRPADKAAANEADVKRYAKLRGDAATLTDAQLEAALQKARESDAPEVEPLRDVAFNDVVCETGNATAAVPLNWRQRVLAALA